MLIKTFENGGRWKLEDLLWEYERKACRKQSIDPRGFLEKKEREDKEKALSLVEARKVGLFQQSRFVCSCMEGVVEVNASSQVASLVSFKLRLLFEEGYVKHIASSVRTQNKV